MHAVSDISGSSLITRRTLAELKAEVERRVARSLPPLAGITAESAQAALGSIASLDRDEWARAWSAVAERHLEAAQAAEPRDAALARREYWQAWRLFNFARWPVENSDLKRRIYPRALDAFRRHGRLLDPPVETLRVPFESTAIVCHLRLPAGVRPAPVVIGASGLDSRKEDVMTHADAYLARGIGLVAVDMPGTGEAPVACDERGERMFSRLIDHLAQRADVDARRILFQGRSWSGYWAAKLAVVERTRLAGAIVHGGPVHHYFDPEWLRPSLDTPEYMYDYFPAKAQLLGAGTIEGLLAAAPRLSLVALGVAHAPAAPMLIVNGARDSQIPIADAHVLLERGGTREAWINPVGGHMGRSPEWPARRIFDEVLLPWMVSRVAPAAP